MAEALARIRFVDGGVNPSIPVNVTTGASGSVALACKEWAISDDVLNMSDTACVTVANVDGENSAKFYPGQRVEIELSDPEVAGGEWIPQFTGLVTEKATASDASGGSVLVLTAMDVGWYLTSCKAQPLINLRKKTFKQALEALIDPSWGIGEIVASNDTNRRLKHGRQVIVQNFSPTQGAILPYIQVEPGQTPFEILQTYAQREGVLINAAADGSLVFFRPNYDQRALFRAEHHAVSDPDSSRNNVVGKPSLRETIDGLYSEVECWSTAVIDPARVSINEATNPNAAFRHQTFTPTTNPLGFARREVFSDPEAIYPKMQRARAKWKWQMGMFQSWTYTIELYGHSQDGAIFSSDTMITVSDSVNGVNGVFYVQSVKKSQTTRNGSRTTLTIRKPGLLNPDLQAWQLGGGAKTAAKTKARPRAKLPKDLARLVR